MKTSRECQHKVSEQAFSCPNCGAPQPAKAQWDGWGFEYKSRASFMGWSLLHVSFKYRANRMPVPAKGIIAIGQFGIGVVTISQFGIGLFSLAQFTIAGYAVAQFAVAGSLIAQFGLYLDQGRGQFVINLSEWLL
ncbi:MAG: zinc ribbon domain-containing protein [Gammaproteobacteria bacterium]